MSDNLFLILVIAFVLIVIAIACLAIGWLITGRTKVPKEIHKSDPSPFEPQSNSTDKKQPPSL